MNLHCSRLKYTILSILWLQYHRIFIWKETYSCMFDVDFKCISNLENDQGCLSYLLTQILMIFKYMKIKHRPSSKCNVNVYVDILAFRKIVFMNYICKFYVILIQPEALTRYAKPLIIEPLIRCVLRCTRRKQPYS